MEKDLDTEYRLKAELYKFHVRLYDRQQERIRRCKKMFVKHVDNSIQPQIASLEPKDAWFYLVKHY